MPRFHCKIYSQSIDLGTQKTIEKVLFSGYTEAVSCDKAKENAWFRAAVQSKKIAKREYGDKKPLNIREKKALDYFRYHYEKKWDYKCDCVEVDGNQSLLNFEGRLNNLFMRII